MGLVDVRQLIQVQGLWHAVEPEEGETIYRCKGYGTLSSQREGETIEYQEDRADVRCHITICALRDAGDQDDRLTFAAILRFVPSEMLALRPCLMT